MTFVTFDVRTVSRTYSVVVGQNLLKRVGEFITDSTDRVFVLTDDVLSEIHLEPLLRGLEKANTESVIKILESGESIKSLETAGEIYDFLVENIASRSDTVLGLGGGVIGDLAGFVASTFKRGMRFVQVPTTLLAQVDSAVGGKTGVNLASGKNLVGTFYQPHVVIADVCVLETLPNEDFIGGLAEAIKYGVIMDRELLDLLVAKKHDILRREPDILALIVEKCLRNKAKVVEKDEREEGGKREVLNYGHTIGHAIETCSGHTVPHGLAVAMGMVEEARYAARMGLLDNDSLESLISIIAMFGLPTDIPTTIDVDEMEAVMRQDKKVRRGQLTLPVLVELGRTVMKMVDSLQYVNP
ncbi:MAG: 3-dehydroquinate synthase [Candidatus Thorarchaeota archaeon]|jgi:3-dehydroquinate synthase